MNSASLLPALSVRNDCGFVLHLRTPKLTAVALQNRVLLHSCMQNHTGCCWGISRSVALFDFFFKDIWDELQCNHNHPSTRVVGFVCFVFVILERAAVLHFLPTVFWVLSRCFLLFHVCLKILLFLCSLTIVWMIKHNMLTAFML